MFDLSPCALLCLSPCALRSSPERPGAGPEPAGVARSRPEAPHGALGDLRVTASSAIFARVTAPSAIFAVGSGSGSPSTQGGRGLDEPGWLQHRVASTQGGLQHRVAEALTSRPWLPDSRPAPLLLQLSIRWPWHGEPTLQTPRAHVRRPLGLWGEATGSSGTIAGRCTCSSRPRPPSKLG